MSEFVKQLRSGCCSVISFETVDVITTPSSQSSSSEDVQSLSDYRRHTQCSVFLFIGWNETWAPQFERSDVVYIVLLLLEKTLPLCTGVLISPLRSVSFSLQCSPGFFFCPVGGNQTHICIMCTFYCMETIPPVVHVCWHFNLEQTARHQQLEIAKM